MRSAAYIFLLKSPNNFPVVFLESAVVNKVEWHCASDYFAVSNRNVLFVTVFVFFKVAFSRPLLSGTTHFFTGTERCRVAHTHTMHDLFFILHTSKHKHTVCMFTSQQTPAVTALIRSSWRRFTSQTGSSSCVASLLPALTFVPFGLRLRLWDLFWEQVQCWLVVLGLYLTCVCVCVCFLPPLCVFFWSRCIPTVWR